MLNWLGVGGLQFVQTFANSEKEACKTAEVLFEMLNKTFKPNIMKHIVTIL